MIDDHVQFEETPTWLEGLTLHVRDVERSRDFYSRIPGARLAAHRPGQFALFRLGEGGLGLLGWGAPGFHVEIATNDLDGLHAQLLQAQLRPRTRPRRRPWGERSFELVDPDGNLLEFQDG